MNRSLGLILSLVLATVVGCQSEKSTYANVKGKVTFNGRPLEKGQIAFTVGGQPPSTMNIVDGVFNGQAMIGQNKISISALKKSATARTYGHGAQSQMESQMKGYREKFKRSPAEGGSTEESDGTMVEAIPPEWNSKSNETRVVEPGAANDFEFNIKSKN